MTWTDKITLIAGSIGGAVYFWGHALIHGIFAIFGLHCPL